MKLYHSLARKILNKNIYTVNTFVFSDPSYPSKTGKNTRLTSI